jgi:2-oxoglutarate ferredoxin oxidoreductase subunit alpha
VSTHPVLNPGGTLDVAVVLNWEDFLRFGGELPVGPETIVIYEAKTKVAPDAVPLKVKPATVLCVPLEEMAIKAAGTELAKNNVVLGLLAGWFGLAQKAIIEGIHKKFAKKGAEVLAGNDRAFAAGIEYAAKNPFAQDKRLSPPAPGKHTAKVLTDGNEMCGAGAIFAGCKFFGGYPITPASEIMQYLQRELPKYGGSVLQAEDEIAGVAAVVGASFAGKKAMTATSGPGLSLKTEVLGLASVAELPLVCVNVQRGGPSTGMPTKPEQADLFAAAFSSHGDNVRPILAPIGVADCFEVIVEAFNLAEQFQTPVIVLSDQEIAQRKEIVDPVDTSKLKLVDRLRPNAQELENYTRFKLNDTGISPLSHPGMKGGAYLAAGIEHNEKGSPTASGEMHARMNDKRLNKLKPLKQRRDLFIIEGDADASIGIIAWGSIAGVVLEAVRIARAAGLKVKALVPKLLYPVAEDIYRDFFASLDHCVVVEQSHQGQLHKIIRMWVDTPKDFNAFAKSGANPITPEEVVQKIREMAK